jgi:hypothetical protein
MQSETSKQYVLVILKERIAFGPFPTADDVEYAVQDYYGTAVTGASYNGAFVIVELRGPDGTADRQREAHLGALLTTDA